MLVVGCTPASNTPAPAATAPEAEVVATEAPTAAAEPTEEPAAAPTEAAPSTEGCLVITGLVGAELTLCETDLRAMEVVNITAEHPKKGSQDFEGVRLNAILDAAQVKPEAQKLAFTADDGYSSELDLAAVRGCADCLVAFGDAGKVSLVMPGMDGSAWVKNVINIEAK